MSPGFRGVVRNAAGSSRYRRPAREWHEKRPLPIHRPELIGLPASLISRGVRSGSDRGTDPAKVLARPAAPRLPGCACGRLDPQRLDRARLPPRTRRGHLSRDRFARMRGPVTFLALSLGCGFAAVASISFVLVLLGLLTLPAVAIVWTLTECGRVGRDAHSTNAVGAHIRRWRRASRTIRGARSAAVATIVGVAAVRWTYPPSRTWAPPRCGIGRTRLRSPTRRASRGPLQWGTLLRPATSKSVLNSFNAGISLLTGRGPLDSMGILLFIVSVSLVIVMIALLWALGLKRLAPLGALALFANQVTGSELTADLTRNLAENWGRLAALVGIIFAIFALRRPSEDGQTADDR